MPGEIAFTRIGASSTASERVRVSAAPLVIATASVPTSILNAATPEKITSEPPVDPVREVLREHQRADHLGVERRRTAARSSSARRPRARADAVETTWSTVPTRSASAAIDGVVGEVDGLGPLAGVGCAEGVAVAAGVDHVGARATRGLADGMRDAAAAADDQHCPAVRGLRHAAALPPSPMLEVAVDAVRRRRSGPARGLEPLAVERDLDAIGLEETRSPIARHVVERRAVGPRGVAAPPMS